MGGLGTMVLRPSGPLGLRTRDRPRTKSQLLRGPSQYLRSSPRGQRGRPSRSHQTIRCSGQALSRSRSRCGCRCSVTTPLGNPCIHSLESGAAAGLLSQGWRCWHSQPPAASPPTPQHRRPHTRAARSASSRSAPSTRPTAIPLWYKDTNNVRARALPRPRRPQLHHGCPAQPGPARLVPGQLPGRGLLVSATATLDAGGGDKALLVTGVEAAFGTADGLPAPGGQISFGRIRIRAAGLVDGATYTVTNPYGVDHIDAEAGAVKGINTTEDIGSLTPNGTFDATLAAKSAPFLKWPTGAPCRLPRRPDGGPRRDRQPLQHQLLPDRGSGRDPSPGSTQLCADATLGDSATATDDCIETDLFTVAGQDRHPGGRGGHEGLLLQLRHRAHDGPVRLLRARPEPGRLRQRDPADQDA